MKELGNLAIVCACRKNTLLQVIDGTVTIHMGCGPNKEMLTAKWHDDIAIRGLIMELNHGRFKESDLC